jgi:hypothetical protein
MPSPSAASRLIELPEPPGGGVDLIGREGDSNRLMAGLLLVAGLFATAWIGSALVVVGRRLRREG